MTYPAEDLMGDEEQMPGGNAPPPERPPGPGPSLGPNPEKNVRQVADEVIAKDVAANEGRPGKGAPPAPPRLPRRLIPESKGAKLSVGLAGGLAAALLAYFIVGAATGGSSSTSATGKKAGAAAVKGSPNCDCPNVNAGLLTREFQKQCQAREDALKILAADNKLNLVAGSDHKLVSGEFCDSVSSGDAAWPVQGGSDTPPRAPPAGKPCTTVSGLARNCAN